MIAGQQPGQPESGDTGQVSCVLFQHFLWLVCRGRLDRGRFHQVMVLPHENAGSSKWERRKGVAILCSIMMITRHWIEVELRKSVRTWQEGRGTCRVSGDGA